MKNLNQFNEKALYVSPSCKSVVLQARESILVGSGDSNFYGSSNRAGIDMEDDAKYTYDF